MNSFIEKINSLLAGHILVMVCALAQPCRSQDIVRAEYFFDVDPGHGNGTPLTVPAAGSLVSFTASISTTGLDPGYHVLFVRTKSLGGPWSLYEPREFTIEGSITEAEYFFDDDPGIGNGTAMTVSTPADLAALTAAIPTTGLQPGYHLLFVRTRTTGGPWSLYDPREF